MSLDDIFNRNLTDKGSAGHCFSQRYEPIFSRFASSPICLLEVGVQFGNSVRAWLEYFPHAQIYGVDCGNEHRIVDARFHFETGNQRDANFWHSWKLRNPPMNVIIDDAEHRVDASKIMFECLWPHLLPGGIYAIEDVCTWFDPYFSSPASGSHWLSEIFAAINHRGLSYAGKPKPEPGFCPTEFEKSLDSVHASKHLLILFKK